MGQPGAVEIVLAGQEDLGLRLQLAKSVGMDDPIAIDLKRIAIVGFALAAVGRAIEALIEAVIHQRRQGRPKPDSRAHKGKSKGVSGDGSTTGSRLLRRLSPA